MSATYRYENIIKGRGDEVVVAESQTKVAVSDVLNRTAEDSLHTRVRVQITAGSITNTVTLLLQHSVFEEEWEDVDATVDVTAITFGDSDVSSSNDTITSSAHGFATGDAVYYTADGEGVVDGLEAGETYYVIKSTDDVIKLATTEANATAGTAIELTAPSDGDSHFLTSLEPMDIILNIENTTDEAKLPLFPKVRVAATSGADDTITISRILVSQRS